MLKCIVQNLFWVRTYVRMNRMVLIGGIAMILFVRINSHRFKFWLDRDLFRASSNHIENGRDRFSRSFYLHFWPRSKDPVNKTCRINNTMKKKKSANNKALKITYTTFPYIVYSDIRQVPTPIFYVPSKTVRYIDYLGWGDSITSKNIRWNKWKYRNKLKNMMKLIKVQFFDI